MDIVKWNIFYNHLNNKIHIEVKPSENTNTTGYEIGLMQSDGSYFVVDLIIYPDKYTEVDYTPGKYSIRRLEGTVKFDWQPPRIIDIDKIYIYGSLQDLNINFPPDEDVSDYIISATISETQIEHERRQILYKSSVKKFNKDGSFFIPVNKNMYYHLHIPRFGYSEHVFIPENAPKFINIYSIPLYRR